MYPNPPCCQLNSIAQKKRHDSGNVAAQFLPGLFLLATNLAYRTWDETSTQFEVFLQCGGEEAARERLESQNFPCVSIRKFWARALARVIQCWPLIQQNISLLGASNHGDARTRSIGLAWMRMPTFSPSMTCLPCTRALSKRAPSAKQARSPNDNPSERVCATKSSASLACSELKAIASRIGLRVASYASSG